MFFVLFFLLCFSNMCFGKCLYKSDFEEQFKALDKTERLTQEQIDRYNPVHFNKFIVYTKNAEELWETDIYHKYIRYGSVALDIGANCGVNTLFMADECHRGFVVAFESDIESCEMLSINATENYYDNIICANIELSDKEERRTNEKIEMMPLDVFKVKHISFMRINVPKIMKMLRGAIRTIKKNKPVIYLKIYENNELPHAVPMEGGGAKLEIIEFLKNLGYFIHDKGDKILAIPLL